MLALARVTSATFTTNIMVTGDEIRIIIQEEFAKLDIEQKISNIVEEKVNEKFTAYKNDLEGNIVGYVKQSVKDELMQFLPMIEQELLRQQSNDAKHEREVLDLQVFTRKRNLIWGGKEEATGETVQSLTADALDLFSNVMQVDNAIVSDMVITAIHRLGNKPRRDNKPRNIVLVLTKLHHIDAVLSKGKNLKNTNFTVRSHLPEPLAKYRSDILKKRRDMLTANPNTHVRVVEFKGIPSLQHKLHPTSDTWTTIESYYNNKDRPTVLNTPLSGLSNYLRALVGPPTVGED